MIAFKAPTMTVADVRFLRSQVPDFREITELRRMLNRRMNELRRRLIGRIVRALYNRYKNDAKNQVSPPSFALWLKEKKQMEHTYLHHSFPTRQYWASRPIRLAQLPQFNNGVENADISWYYELFEELVNTMDPQGVFRTIATPGVTNGEVYSGNSTIDFDTELRTAA
jgi:hypothetical protein